MYTYMYKNNISLILMLKNNIYFIDIFKNKYLLHTLSMTYIGKYALSYQQ